MKCLEKNTEELKIRFIKKSFMILMLLFGVVLFTVAGIEGNKKYIYYQEIVIPITAEITEIDEFDEADCVGAKDYSMYISYSYDGTVIENVYWKTFDTKDRAVGDTVTILIDPNNPNYIFEGSKTGKVGVLSGLFISLVVLLVALHLLIEMVHFRKNIGYDKKLKITENMIANDLKPRRRIIVANCLMFIGVALVSGQILPSTIFPARDEKIGIILIAIGVIIQLSALIGVIFIPKRKYEIYIDKCLHIGSDDGEEYAIFEKLGYEYCKAIAGERYYIIKNKRNRLCGMYDVRLWQTSINNLSLVKGSRKLIKDLIVDLVIYIISAMIYIGSVYIILIYYY